MLPGSGLSTSRISCTMIGRCVPAGVLPDSTTFCSVSGYFSSACSLYFSENLRGYLPEYRGRRLCCSFMIQRTATIKPLHAVEPFPKYGCVCETIREGNGSDQWPADLHRIRIQPPPETRNRHPAVAQFFAQGTETGRLLGRRVDGRFHACFGHHRISSLERQSRSGLAAQSRQPPSVYATAGWRLEHLPRRAVGGKRHDQGVSRTETGGCSGYRFSHAARAPNGLKPWRRAADEHLFETLSRVDRAFSVGFCPNHPERNHSHRQMVPRELQRNELVEPVDACAAGDHQSL